MPSRRQEKVARVIKEAVSDAITNHLSDPRIGGFISVTKVDVAPNIRSAEVYVSIFGQDETGQRKTFAAIEHGKSRIQSLMAHKLQIKFCPVLHFFRDEDFKKTIETMRLINEATRELEERYADDENENEDENEDENE